MVRQKADMCGFENGVTIEEWSSLVLYYDHMNSIIRNTPLLYIYYFSPIG